MKPQILFLIFAICSVLKADETNKLYLTDDGKSPAGWSLHPEKNTQMVETAKLTRESLPAEDFPEGNWGTVQDGYQLSLRFNRQIYTNGEAISATVLLRNMTNHILRYPVGAYVDCPVGFSVKSDTGKPISPRQTFSAGISAWQVFLPPNTQHKYVGRLNDRYDLTNGTYSVYAFKVIGLNHEAVKSADTQIKIEDIPKN